MKTKVKVYDKRAENGASIGDYVCLTFQGDLNLGRALAVMSYDKRFVVLKDLDETGHHVGDIWEDDGSFGIQVVESLTIVIEG